MYQLNHQKVFFQHKHVKQSLFLLLTSLLILSSPAVAQTTPTTPAPKPVQTQQVSPQHAQRPQIDQVITAAMKEQKLVGLALGLVEAGQITYLKGYGWADQEQKIAVTQNSSFRWASISKPVTAILSMQLVEENKLDLDKDIRTYWPEYNNAQGWPVTQRQLLSHLAGVGHYGEIPNWQSGLKKYRDLQGINQPDVVQASKLIFAEAPLLSLPGSKYHYSTFGSMLAGAVLSKADGNSYVTQFEERIRRPLQLTSMQADIQGVFIPYRVSGYYRKNGIIKKRAGNDVSWKLPGGGFTSNIRDLSRFMQALINHELVSNSSETKMWTSQQTNTGTLTGYGLSFGLSELYRQKRIEHFGAQQNTRTAMSFLPEQKLGLVIMCNSEWADLGQIRDQLYEVLQANTHPWSMP